MKPKHLPPLDVMECRSQLLWANNRELEDRHLHMAADFAPETVCWLVERGSVTIDSTHGKTKAGNGEWLFPGAFPAEQHFSKRSRILSIRFLLDFRGGRPLLDRSKSRVIRSVDFPELETAARNLIDCLQPWSDRESLLVGRNRIPFDENLKIEAVFYQWLSVYIRCQHHLGEQIESATPSDSRVRQALIRMEDMSFRERFSEQMLAAECGCSVNHLAKLFKEETGITPFQYYDRLRLERARHVLSDTRMQIKEIAFELGFHSSPHFSNWFKLRTGTAPRRFRIKNEAEN